MFWKKNKPEVCGYLDDNDRFYRDRTARDISNLEIVKNQIIQEIDKIFDNSIHSYTFANMRPLIISNDKGILKDFLRHVMGENKLRLTSLHETIDQIDKQIHKLKNR